MRFALPLIEARYGRAAGSAPATANDAHCLQISHGAVSITGRGVATCTRDPLLYRPRLHPYPLTRCPPPPPPKLASCWPLSPTLAQHDAGFGSSLAVNSCVRYKCDVWTFLAYFKPERNSRKECFPVQKKMIKIQDCGEPS